MSGRIVFSLTATLLLTAHSSAQVVVRAPFVRVETGAPGTYIRAPFVSLYFPPNPPFYYAPPPVVFGPPPAFPVAPNLAPPFPVLPANPAVPKVPQPLPPGPEPEIGRDNNPDFAPPMPAQVPAAPSIAEFAKAFKPKAGNYEVTLTNPINQQQETVKFSLPAEPRQVRTGRNHIEFVYGPRQYVRIEFDRDGPIVITR